MIDKKFALAVDTYISGKMPLKTAEVFGNVSMEDGKAQETYANYLYVFQEVARGSKRMTDYCNRYFKQLMLEDATVDSDIPKRIQYLSAAIKNASKFFESYAFTEEVKNAVKYLEEEDETFSVLDELDEGGTSPIALVNPDSEDGAEVEFAILKKGENGELIAVAADGDEVTIDPEQIKDIDDYATVPSALQGLGGELPAADASATSPISGEEEAEMSKPVEGEGVESEMGVEGGEQEEEPVEGEEEEEAVESKEKEGKQFMESTKKVEEDLKPINIDFVDIFEESYGWGKPTEAEENGRGRSRNRHVSEYDYFTEGEFTPAEKDKKMTPAETLINQYFNGGKTPGSPVSGAKSGGDKLKEPVGERKKVVPPQAEKLPQSAKGDAEAKSTLDKSGFKVEHKFIKDTKKVEGSKKKLIVFKG